LGFDKREVGLERSRPAKGAKASEPHGKENGLTKKKI
jgi:hypothetical protein